MVYEGTAGRGPSGGWRFCLAALLVSVGLVGCKADPAVECTTTYQHLLQLARRNNDAALMGKFVDACRDAFDPERLACIRGAETTGEALACKPVRKRPG